MPDFAMAGMMAPGMGGGIGGGFPQPAPVNSGSLATVDRVRNVFPETWLWTNTTSGYPPRSFSRHCFRYMFVVCLTASTQYS